HRHEVASFVVIVHCRHREDDSVERLLRELLVDVKRWSNSKDHLMASLLLEFSCDGLRRHLRRSDTKYTYLGCCGEGRCHDECKRTDGYSAKRWAHDVLNERCCGHCARIYTRGRLSPIRFKGRVGRGIPALFSSQGQCVVGRARRAASRGSTPTTSWLARGTAFRRLPLILRWKYLSRSPYRLRPRHDLPQHRKN